MSPLGLRLTQGFTRAATSLQARYDGAPLAVRQSFLPFALASLPLVIGTTLGVALLIPVIALLSMVLLHQVATASEAMMFEVNKVRSHIAVTMPLCGFISAWGVGLAVAGRPAMMLSIVAPYSMLLLLSCAPAFRLRESRTKRRVPLKFSFPAIAAIAWLATLRPLFGS